MRNIRLEIEYDGTNFCGWQIQKSHTPQAPAAGGSAYGGTRHRLKRSIQETIENAFQKILGEKIRLIASGRTDAGVHARAQTANFHCLSAINLNKLHPAINALLPDDIAVNKLQEVPLDFHSRFNAESKVYRYIILNRRYHSPFLRNYVYLCRYPLDLKIMQQETRTIIGRHDFKAFCASGSKVKGTVRTIKDITIKRDDPDWSSGSLITIDIEADGFLYNMARNIVGTLIEIGRGKFPKGSLRRILLSRDRKLAGPTAPAHGLHLVKVNY